MNRKKLIIKCPKCKGTGKVLKGFGAGPLAETLEVKCGYCTGSGLIERVIEIEDKPYIPQQHEPRRTYQIEA